MPVATRLETLPDQVSPTVAARWMLWGIAGFTGLMIVWAGLAPVNETAIAQGRIVPQRQLQVVSNLEGGSITEIGVRPGQRVVAGAVLLRLDPDSARAEFGRSSAASNALNARIARLEAEIAGRAPVFDPALAAAAPAAVAAEQALWAAHLSDVSAASAGDNARIDGTARNLAGAEADRAVRAEASAQAAREVTMIAPLVDKGIEPAISLVRAKSALSQARSSEAAAVQAVQRAAAAIAEARAAARGNTGRTRSSAADALTAARAELAGQSAALPALRGRVARADVRAPIAGIVQRVLVSTIGGSVRPGEPLVEIVPVGDTLVVEARVRPIDIAFVHAGQKAAVKLTAYDSSVYGALRGKVTRISPDAVVDDRSGDSYYLIRIETSASGLTAPDGARLPIAPGMVAAVDLIGRKRSVLSYLLSPVTKLSENAFRER